MNYDPEHLAQWMIDVLCGIEEVNNPYKDEILTDNSWIRTFDKSITESEEYVWHRDNKDRIVTVVDGTGWQFQFDNEIPIQLNRSDVINIPKHTYHRLIVGLTELKLKIEEVE